MSEPNPCQPDAYLAWAQHTAFAHYGPVLPNPTERLVGLLVEWSGPAPYATAFAKVANWVQMAHVYQGQRIASITVNVKDLPALLASGSFTRVELATPVATYQGAAGTASKPAPTLPNNGPTLASDVVLGCIDDGFPIANRRFHHPTSGQTRLLRFWNQESTPWAQGKPLGSWHDDPVGTNFGYGSELVPDTPASQSANVSLPAPSDALDDQRYYQRRQLRRALNRVTHGAHVLGVMADALPVRSRIPASRDKTAGGDGSASKPPSRAAEVGTTATTAPIVLVQLPQYALDDPSGRWLGRNALDGLHYILQTATLLSTPTQPVKKVVVNLSWGPQTGPHDGNALLEQAFDDLVAQGKKIGRDVDITVPAGNSYASRAHAQWEARQGTAKALQWCVPPGGESPAFLEVWWPAGSPANEASLAVTAPDGSALTSSGRGIWSHAVGGKFIWGITQVQHGTSVMALIALAPTGPHSAAPGAAPHGVWQISVAPTSTSAPATALAHAYVARADHNMGSKRRAQASYLRDPIYETLRRSKDAERAPDAPGSQVKKAGSLNGLGTTPSVAMAAGYRLSDGEPARYSSSGPSRGTRSAPDWAYPTEVSRRVGGVPAGGTRAGTVVRLIGTSAAAPQMARELANRTLPSGPSGPPAPHFDPRLGQGKR